MSDATKLIELLRAASVKGGMCDVAADLIEQQAARIAELEALATVAPAVYAQPVAWRIFDGEGGYDYRDEPPPEVNVAWAAKHGRKYEPLYTEPQSSQSTQSEPVAWANVKDDGTIVGLSQHPEDIANWQNPRPLCYQCEGCGDSEYGPWRCSRCEGSGFESAPNAAQSEGLRKDAEQYRWLRDTLHGAKAGGGVEVNNALQFYEKPHPGEEVRIYWYQDTPVGFCEVKASTLGAAIDSAVSRHTGEKS